MASFTASRVGTAAPCFQTNKLFDNTSTSSIDFRRRRQRRCARITSMGGTAKFKGTQMREKKLTELIEEKVREAKQVCEGDDHISDECKVAWDEVEEISQAKADLRLKLERDQDPLQSFCEDNPETDECRIYED